ncbi:MAG: hypothetical protein ACFB0C_02990 [Leptolyngbyaceae cyanobacterium]
MITAAISLVLWLMLGMMPAMAETYSFKTQGIPKRDGLLIGKLVYKETALQDAVKRTEKNGGVTAPVPISEIEGAEFSMKYISPYSGAEHSESTLCGKAVYDINGFEETPLSGGNIPMLVVSNNGLPESLDFSSCVGEAGNANLSISERDSRVVFSTLDSLFGKLTVFDKDVMGNELYRKIQPIKFTLTLKP